MLTPADIDTKQFSTTRLREGYDQDEVDSFLDAVKVDYENALDRAAKAEAEAARLKRIVDASSDAPTTRIPAVAQTPSAVAERLLVVAQQTADTHVADAQVKADEIVREAGGKAARLIEDAASAADSQRAQALLEAEKIRSEARADQKRILDDLTLREAQVSKAVGELETKGKNLRDGLNRALIAFDQGMGA